MFQRIELGNQRETWASWHSALGCGICLGGSNSNYHHPEPSQAQSHENTAILAQIAAQGSAHITDSTHSIAEILLREMKGSLDREVPRVWGEGFL